MNKNIKILALTFVSVTSFYSMSYAGKVNNNTGVQGGYGKMALGFEYDSGSERDMQFESGIIVEGGGTEPFLLAGDTITGGNFESSRIMVRGSVGLTDWMDVFLQLGVADADFSYQLNEAPGPPPETIIFSGDPGVGFGLGLKAAIADVEGYQIYSNLQLFQLEVDGTYSVDGLVAPGSSSEATVQEIQLAFYAAKTFDMWTPYGGLKFSESNVEIETSVPVLGVPEISTEEHQADGNIGVFIGTDVVLKPGLSANIELRLVDESALSLGLNWVF